MGKPLCRSNGLHQWDARVSAVRSGELRRTIDITVFCDTRQEAVAAACAEVQRLGYSHCTVDHITKIGGLYV